jgi:hypothetical protein
VPSFLYEGSGDFDPVTRKWIHHGGHDGIPQGFHTFLFDLETSKWEQKFPANSPPGVCCIDGASAFDLSCRRFVRFPGGMLGHGYQWSRGEKLKDSAVWLYDPGRNAWANMRPTPYTEPEKGPPQGVGGLNSGAVYVPNHEIVLSFGGQGNSGGKNTLFAYDAHANSFHHIKATNPPPARDGMGMAYDVKHYKLVMFGSQYSPDEKTWLYDLETNKWEGLALDPHPPAVKATKEYSTIPRMAYDPVNGVILCVAWLGDRGHETWMFDTGKREWKQLSPKTEPDPSKSRSRNLGYDAARNVFILETSGAKSNRPEIWTYRYKNAKPNTLLTAPTDLTVVTEAGGKAKLSWKPVAGAKRYEIYCTTPKFAWESTGGVLVGTSTESNFEDKGLDAGTVYYYSVGVIGKDGAFSVSSRARTQPKVLPQPVVSVLAKNKIEVTWSKHSASDVLGYNVYRGVVQVRTVAEGTPGAWKDNDPKYDEPQVVQVRDITQLKKLNDKPLTTTALTDTIDLSEKGKESGEYKYAVYAYVVRSVNQLGTESGPSPYALTIPTEPLNVLCREDGEVAALKWDAASEKNVTGYHIYKLEGTWKIVRVTEKPITETSFRHKVGKGQTRFWVVTVDALGQEGQPSSPAWFNHSYRGFYTGEWHQ